MKMNRMNRVMKDMRYFVKLYHDRGRSDGLAWAAEAEGDDLRYAVDYATFDETLVDNRSDLYFDPRNDQILGKYFSEIIDFFDLFKLHKPRSKRFIPNEFYRAWESGWKKGVLDYWARRKPDLD